MFGVPALGARTELKRSWPLLLAVLTLSGTAEVQAQSDEPAASDGQTCAPQAIPLTRQLRQLYLDLLGRPPSIDEYRAIESKGSIEASDIDELMTRDEFYARMKTYHRALLRANVSASLPTNNDTRVATTNDGQKPLETRGNFASALRGRNGIGCDHFVPQDQCTNPTYQQDPHAEGAAASKVCRDANGVPLPVSFDYDTAVYTCTALAPATSCSDAVTRGLLEAKHLFFCDMRRSGMGVLEPFKCLPDRTKPTTAALTTEELDTQGRVIAFSTATPAPGAAFSKLERCTLTMPPRNGLRGTYTVQRGCLQREGWVMANAPFWDTSGNAQVATCAIEAQTRTVNPATMTSCEGGNFLGDRSCGCGESFRRCEAGDGSVYNARAAAINEEPLLIADSVLRRDEDYFQILTTRRSYINGVLSALYRERQAPGVLAITPPLAVDALPQLAFNTADQWSEYVRDEQASGVLTTPAFLYRFPTQRARVAEFYQAFLCKTFAPPADAIAPDPEDACNRENNLAKRCGCTYCHATIEPTGAHWGRFGERNAQYLSPSQFPKFDVKCRDCALNGDTNCGGECGNYVMQAYDGDGANSLGMLKTYLYRTSQDEPNIEGGPRQLVQRMLQTGDLERCAVQRVWEELLGRPMTGEEQRLYLEQLVQGFVADGRNFKRLIRRVLSTDAYKRVD